MCLRSTTCSTISRAAAVADEPRDQPLFVVDDETALTKSEVLWLKQMRQEFTPERVRYFRRITDAGMAAGFLLALITALAAIFGFDRLAKGLIRVLESLGAQH